MKDLAGKHIFFTCGLSWPENGIYRVLRRINRETNSQYISDVQRVPEVKWPKGGRKIDWEKKVWFQKIAKRYRKNKLFDDNGNFTDHYGDATIVSDSDYSVMISDKPFDELFTVVKGDGEDDLFEHDLKTFKKKLGVGGFLTRKYRKRNKEGYLLHDVCIDTNSFIGQYLKEVFGVDVYVADRMWCDKRFVGDQYCGSNYSFEYSRECDFDRNAVFYQVTSSGGDKPVISKEENNHNCPVFLWFFEDRIVYKEDSGRGEF
jgi:hypothetical protein